MYYQYAVIMLITVGACLTIWWALNGLTKSNSTYMRYMRTRKKEELRAYLSSTDERLRTTREYYFPGQVCVRVFSGWFLVIDKGLPRHRYGIRDLIPAQGAALDEAERAVLLYCQLYNGDVDFAYLYMRSCAAAKAAARGSQV